MTYNVLGGNVNSITIGLYNSKTKWKHVFFRIGQLVHQLTTNQLASV